MTDVAWGFLDSGHLKALLYADTVIYFAAMAVTVYLWTRYVILYLEEKNFFSATLNQIGRIFLLFELAAIAVNFFYPVLFHFDENAVYYADPARYLTLGIQILMFLLTSVYTLTITVKTEGSVRQRHRVIGIFGLIMTIFVSIQIYYPLMSLYSMGFTLGICLLHTFVVEGEKEEYRKELEEALKREQQQKKELGSAKRMAYTDPLTGVKNKLAYLEKEEDMDRRIASQKVEAFGVVVFDLNGLKLINDTKGHEVGDQYIMAACRIICNHFKHSPVYRIGGDEFTAVLEGEDYRNRKSLLNAFNTLMDENLKKGQEVIASGMAEYIPNQDDHSQNIFDRADMRMYQRKRELKERTA